MGWSMGNVTSTAVLGYPEAIGEKSYNRLDQLLRKLIMYGKYLLYVVNLGLCLHRGQTHPPLRSVTTNLPRVTNRLA